MAKSTEILDKMNKTFNLIKEQVSSVQLKLKAIVKNFEMKMQSMVAKQEELQVRLAQKDIECYMKRNLVEIGELGKRVEGFEGVLEQVQMVTKPV